MRGLISLLFPADDRGTVLSEAQALASLAIPMRKFAEVVA